MPLNFQFNTSTFDTIKDETGINDVFVYATMFVGIREITEANYREFYARLNLLQRINGAYLNSGGKPHYITLEDVQRRIGLTTNAGTLTRPQFIKTKVGNYFDEIVGRTK